MQTTADARVMQGAQQPILQMSTGINIAVSVVIGAFLLFGIVAGAVRVRRQQNAHRVRFPAHRAGQAQTRLLARLRLPGDLAGSLRQPQWQPLQDVHWKNKAEESSGTCSGAALLSGGGH